MIPLDAAASVLALGGAAIQAVQSLRRLKEVDPAGHTAFFAVDDLKTEYAITRHPVRSLQQRRQVAELLRESPVEAKMYKRFRLQLIAWMILGFASAISVVAAFVG